MSAQSVLIVDDRASNEAARGRRDGDRTPAAAANAESRTDGSELFGIVVHELRQPLTVIRGQLQLARRQIGHDQQRERETIDLAIAQVDRMTTLLTALVDAQTFARNGLGVTMVPLDLVPLVVEAIARHEDRTTRRIGFRAPVHPIIVRGDPERIAEILDNLLSNARKYSPPEAPIDVSVIVRAGAARILVADHGVGVPAAEQARLFAPFYRASTARSIDGTGIGLHLSRQLAEKQGGRLWLEASSTAGSVFALELPISMVSSAALSR
jgi:signal transduction histidine kinase